MEVSGGGELTVESFLASFEKDCDKVIARAKAYAASPTPEAVHGARTAIRRLHASYGLLTKRLRGKKRVRRLEKWSTKLFRLSTKIRDLDIVGEKLKTASPNGAADYSPLLASLEKERSARLKRATQAAEKLATLSPPTIKGWKLRESKLRKRFGEKLRENESRLLKRASILVDEGAGGDAHPVRKACKELRYLLEIEPKSPERDRALEVLRQWQDLLGAVQDAGVVRRYLDPLRRRYRVKPVLDEENAESRRKLEQFLALWKSGAPDAALFGQLGLRQAETA